MNPLQSSSVKTILNKDIAFFRCLFIWRFCSTDLQAFYQSSHYNVDHFLFNEITCACSGLIRHSLWGKLLFPSLDSLTIDCLWDLWFWDLASVVCWLHVWRGWRCKNEASPQKMWRWSSTLNTSFKDWLWIRTLIDMSYSECNFQFAHTHEVDLFWVGICTH